jgi:cation/acetate symporter
MATAAGGDFISRLPKIYGMYTGGFLVFLVVLALAEYFFNLSDRTIGYVFLAATIGLYAMIGIMSRTMSSDEYYVAGRRVPAVFNGMATASDWMSAASFIGMAGTLYVQGYDGLAFIMGWTGGYVLVALLIAPYLRKFGQYTIPDFLGARYGGNTIRLIGVVCAIVVSFVYLMAQLSGAGLIMSRFLGIEMMWGIIAALGGVLVCSMLGGMRAVTWTQVAQYIVLIIAYLIPVIWMSIQVTGNPIPQFAYGGVLEKIGELEQQFGVAAGHVVPFARTDMANFLALTFCLMVGTAGLPHVLMRFYTVPSVKEARTSVGWALLFIFLLYFTAPAYAVFAKYAVYTDVIGKGLDQLPQWVAYWGKIGVVAVCDAVDAAATIKGCTQGATLINGNGDGIVQLKELWLHGDAIVLATPEIAGLPYVISGLVAAGGLAAALSTADGLLLTMSNALSHDFYTKVINPGASVVQRLTIARVLLVAIAAIAAYATIHAPATILQLVGQAFSLAASAFFPALFLGVFWKRANKAGAIAGMLVGFLLAGYYIGGVGWNFNALLGVSFFPAPSNPDPALDGRWFGINAISGGIFGMPAGLLTMIVVSLLTKDTSPDIKAMVENIRYPRLSRA